VLEEEPEVRDEGADQREEDAELDRHAVVVVGRKAWVWRRWAGRTQLTDLSPQTSANAPNRLTQTVLEERSGPRRPLRKDAIKMASSPQMRAKSVLFRAIDGVISLWGFGENSRPTGVYATVDGAPHFLSTRAAEHLLNLG
jgi:hypothetical protein